jgi:hypothetical protein
MDLESLLIDLRNQGYFPKIYLVEDFDGDLVWKAAISYGPTIFEAKIAYSEISPMVALEIAYSALKEMKTDGN